MAGGVATLAEQPGFTPNYIFPLADGAHFTIANGEDFESLLFRPLYNFTTANNVVQLDSEDSLADTPTFSNGDKTVTVTLKKYDWSDGTPVSSRDVVFWMNLLKANTANWGNYVPGNFPDNVLSYKAVGPSTVVFQLNRAYSPQWFTDNELAQITPLPQQAWDKTSTSSADGNYDESTSGAKAVYSYLNAQALDTSTYVTNPLWKVVDGPWRLVSFSNTGALSYKPNARYSGPKPHISEFQEVPYTSSAAEVNSLFSGSNLSVGYLPTEDLPEKSRVTAGGKYTLERTALFSINYIELNFDNPNTGPLVKQLYIRQALQSVMDQPGQVHALLHGGGYPDYGPIPPQPVTKYLTPEQQKGVYPFSPQAARHLLLSHGWSVPASGTATCARPGTGTGECGAGISAGAKLTFNLLYSSGSAYLTSEMANYKSDAGQAGITLNLSSSPINTVIAQARTCAKASCWQMLTFGGGGASWTFSPYPSGEAQFATGAQDDGGNYSDPKADKLIHETQYSASTAAMNQYDNYLTEQLPVIWQMDTYSYNAVRSNLHGVVFNQLGQYDYITPEQWFFS